MGCLIGVNMIINPEQIPKTFKLYRCKRKVAYYLIYEAHLSFVAYDKSGCYSFSDTEELREALKKMPLSLKIIKLLTG